MFLEEWIQRNFCFLEKESKDHGTKEGTADFEKAMEMCGKSFSLCNC